ncbi:MAG: endonuclease MutS2 [Dehalococcoidales bacterium]|nr:endonuclease MutS2 [Dehalococcoidales bacterium]
MDEKSLEMLEFSRIKEILADHTSFSAGRELALALAPEHDDGLIHLRLKQTAEARRLLDIEPGFTIKSISDIREKVRLASLSAIIDPSGLLEIQRTLSSLHELRSRLKDAAKDFPLLWEIAGRITPLPQVEKNIAGCLSPEGEVLDMASPELARIRQELKQTRAQILERLEAITRSPRWQRILQEDIITEREGRYVILVKTECRHEIKGIVHDISNTGATVFIEPSSTVGLGNAMRELVIEERREVERILARLSAEVGSHREEIDENVALAAQLDLIFAKAKYARAVKAAEPEIIIPEAGKNIIRLINARHPLLGSRAVPFSLTLGKDFSVLVITGPNTGGKTVTLKTIGLLSLMALAGIPIPASGDSQIPVFDGIFADIGDEQSIEQTISSFSWHMGNIARILKKATGRSLVLLDELGTSTDPIEGTALAKAVLRHFLARGSLVVATTHYSDLKAFAHATAGFQNASLEFDPVTLSPTYQLRVGVPGGSNALAAAMRLGIPEEIISEARSWLAGGSLELEKLLNSLMTENQKVARLRQELEREKEELERRNAEMENELKRLREEKERVKLEARDEIVRRAAELNRLIREASNELRKAKSEKSITLARQTLATVREKLESPAWKTEVSPAASPADRPLQVGDSVLIRDVGLNGIVTAISEETREVEVQAGRTKLRLGMESVVRSTPAASTPPPAGTMPAVTRIPRELDLRGRRADEVEAALDGYLNDAVKADLTEVRIIHGIGTGTVRNIVRQFLATHPLVRSFRPGERSEGGDGATVVRL